MFKKAIVLCAGVLALLAIMAVAAASTNRGLPAANLNNVAGANRSNVAWSFGNDWITGDDFTVGSAGQTWVVTGLRTWATAGSPTDTSFQLGDRFDSVSLYGGPSSPGGVSLISTGTLSVDSNVNSNPSITHTFVHYVGGVDYQGSSGSFIRIWQNDFNNLAWVVNGGQKYNFAVDGTLRTGVINYWFNHASNAALSGSAQQGADNLYLAWDKTSLSTAPFVCDSANAITCGGWDKSSDVNVIVTAVQVATNKGLCKDGGWRTLVRLDASPFKNQGVCVSYAEKLNEHDDEHNGEDDGNHDEGRGDNHDGNHGDERDD